MTEGVQGMKTEGYEVDVAIEKKEEKIWVQDGRLRQNISRKEKLRQES